MRKKYLSALLFGALLVTSAGTFTSCKDYDDDINNLQEQIDKLATKEDMEAKLSQMQTAIDAAKKTAEDALAKAEAAGDSKEIEDLKNRVAALEEAMKKVETLKAEIKTMVDEEIADFRVEMQEFMKEVEELTGYSLGMVTGISFVVNKPSELSPALNANFARVNTIYIPDADYEAGTQDDSKDGFKVAGNSYTFGKDLAGAFTINVKDVNTVADEMLVKLDPVDAVVSSEMLSLINGKGEDLNGYVNMTVKPWSGDIIASRSEAKTGLYEVGVQLKNDVDFEAFDKMVLPVPGHDWSNCEGDKAHKFNMFALAVTDTEKSRTVTSDYKVSLHVQEEEEAIGIPANTNVVSIGTNDATSSKNIASSTGATEDKGCIEVKLGASFDLMVGSAYNAEEPDGGRVMASYVVVDINNKDLSSTDKAAINGLTITGVDEVSKSLKHTITINGATGVAVPMKLVTIDYTGVVKENIFWVKAGEGIELSSAFTITPVQFIDNPTAWSANELVDLEKADLQEFTIPTGTISGRLDMIIGEADNTPIKYNNTFTIGAANGKLTSGTITVGGVNVIQLYTANKTKAVAGTPIKDVAYAAFIGTMNLQNMREDKAYEGTIKFYGEEGDDYVGARMISVTKKLPTDIPAGFSAKTNTIVNGVMTVYPKPLTGNEKSYSWPSSGNAAINTKGNDVDGKDYTLGYFDLLESFNGWVEHNTVVGYQDTWKLNNGYGLTVKGVTDTPVSNASPNPKLADYTENLYDGKNFKGQISSIRPSIIGNGEAYESIVKYNYGNIKYAPVGHGVDINTNHTVEWSTKLDMKFGHWIKDSKFQWTTGENPVVIAGQKTTIFGKVTKSTVNGVEKVTAVEPVISVTAPNNETANPFVKEDANWTPWAPQFVSTVTTAKDQNVTIELRTVGENGSVRKNEFFTAMFGQAKYDGFAKNRTVIELNPSTYPSVVVGNDVETKVYFIFTDKFGVKQEVHALTFTMKYSK